MAGQVMRLLSLVWLLDLLTIVHACSVVNWKELSMEERLFKSDIVVLGTDTYHVRVWQEGMPMYVSEFEVLCVFKDDGSPVNESISIEGILGGNSCSGTDGKVDVGDTVIAALTRTESGNYMWHEVNVMQSAVWEYSHANIMRVASVCGLQQWTGPENLTMNATRDGTDPSPECPIVTIPLMCNSSGAMEPALATKLFMLSLGVLYSAVLVCLN